MAAVDERRHHLNAGIVERRPDPDDARAAQVSITAEGACIIGESRAAKQAWLDRMMSERSRRRSDARSAKPLLCWSHAQP